MRLMLLRVILIILNSMSVKSEMLSFFCLFVTIIDLSTIVDRDILKQRFRKRYLESSSSKSAAYDLFIGFKYKYL